MKLRIFFALACVATALKAQETAAPEKRPCKTPAYSNERPALAGLDLTQQEKKDITALAKRGRKIDAIRIMRRCNDMSLKEQKVIVDALFSNY
jgi:ribosomal protein L7/L12